MTSADPTPRPIAGTDLAPCPDCGQPIRVRAWPVPGTYAHCGVCGWEIHTERVVDLTLAGSPWTRALWVEVERLRRIKHDLDEENVQQSMAFNRKIVDAGLRVGLQKVGMGAKPCTVDDFVAEVERLRLDAEELRLVLAAEQGRQEGAPSSGWAWDGRSWRRPGHALGRAKVERERSVACWITQSGVGGVVLHMRAAMQAADEAEAQAAAGREPEAKRGRRCDCCENAAERVVTTGPRSDRLTICADCLREALAVLEAAP